MGRNIEEIKGIISQVRGNDKELQELDICEGFNFDDNINLISKYISSNNTLKSLKITKDIVPQEAETLFNAYMSSGSLAKLIMPLWSVVNTPSQKTLMSLQRDFESSAESHNDTSLEAEEKFSSFKKSMDDRFVRVSLKMSEHSKNKRRKILTRYDLPDTILDIIREYTVPIKKNLSL